MLIAWHRPIWPIFMAFNLEAHFCPMLARDPLGEVALSIQNHQKCSTENVKRILRQPHHDQQRGTPITQTIIIQIIWTQVDRGVWEVWTSYTSEFLFIIRLSLTKVAFHLFQNFWAPWSPSHPRPAYAIPLPKLAHTIKCLFTFPASSS